MSSLNSATTRRYGPSLAALFIGLAATVALFAIQWRHAARVDQVRFDTLTHFMQERLDDRMEKYEQTVVLVREFFIRNGLPSRTQWLQLVDRLRLPLNCPGIQGLGYAPRLVGRQLDSPSPNLRAALGENTVNFAKVGAEEVIWPVLYWYAKPPLPDPPMGFDLHHSTLPWILAEWSAGHNALHVTGRLPGGASEPPFDLAGFCMVHTVLEGDSSLAMPFGPGENFADTWNRQANARLPHWQGTLVAKIDMDQFLKDLLDGSVLEVGFEIFDGPDPVRAARLNRKAGLPLPADRARRPGLEHRISIWPMYNQRWSIAFYPTVEFERNSPRRISWIALGAGLVSTIFLTGLVWLESQRRSTAEAYSRQIKEARDVITALSHEREQISRDLHDGVLQSLYVLGLGMRQAQRTIRADPALAERRCEQNLDGLELAMAELRRHLGKKGPEPSPEIDLGLALRRLVEVMNRQGTVPVQFESKPELGLCPLPETVVQMLQIAREAITNAQRHSGAVLIRLALEELEGGLLMNIADDGCGLDPGRPAGHGLRNMAARAAGIGAEFQIHSPVAGGVLVSLYLPSARCVRRAAPQ